MQPERLEDWGESIKPIAKLAYEGKGEQHPGDWCRFCRAKPVCRACADEALALCREEFLDLDAGAFTDDTEETDMAAPYTPDTDTAVFKQPGLSLWTIGRDTSNLNRISSWIESVFAFCLGGGNQSRRPIRLQVGRRPEQAGIHRQKAVVDAAVQRLYRPLQAAAHQPD